MSSPSERLPWQQLDDESTLPGLEERVTHPGFDGIQFLHVRAKSIINDVPEAAGLPFQHTINAYRGCTHACSYCLHGDTPILMADGCTKPLADIRPGDEVYGTVHEGRYRRYVPTPVLNHWATVKPAYRVTLADGTELISSGDHRFLSERGWKHVTGTEQGVGRRPHLTLNNELRGIGQLPAQPKHDSQYRRGYLCGMIRGDAHLGSYCYDREGRAHGDVFRFRLALADEEALDRTQRWLKREGIATDQFLFTAETAARREIRALRNYSRQAFHRITDLIRWPPAPTRAWRQGFLAGIFDSEGSYSRGILRISNCDPDILRTIGESLEAFGFDFVFENSVDRPTLHTVRIRGGFSEQIRFFLTTDPAITRKRTFDGRALKSDVSLDVTSIEALDIQLRLYDITTGTGDFIADGVVSHNCFARPSHRYLELDPAEEFESVIVVKTNAVPLLRAELRRPSWAGDHIAMGTNTDPYQRCEGRYELTRGIIETLTEVGNPYSVLTKGTLPVRDLDVLTAAQERRPTAVNFSIPTFDEEVWRTTEPGTPHPRRRMETLARLNDAGVPSGVMLAPVIPGMSDGREQLREVVEAAVEAGATFVRPIVLHLRSGVKEIFTGWLEEHRPDLLERYEREYRGSRAPREVRRRICATVDDLVEEAGGTRGQVDARRPGRAGTAGDTPARPRGEQLGLGV